jgi:hypothetical protein
VLFPYHIAVTAPDARRVLLDIQTRRINSLFSVIFYSDTKKEYLWVIRPNQIVNKVEYGVREGFRQSFPFDEKPPRNVEPNERLVVCIVFQYDSLTAACVDEAFYSVELGPENGISKIERLKEYHTPELLK